jgi:hypothetical protein
VKDQAQIPPILHVANSFQKLVKAESFDPSPDVIGKIQSGERVLSHLTNELLQGKWAVSEPEAEAVMGSIRLFLIKVDSLVEEGYQKRDVVANVPPPPGVPNASAGMNPDAIQDQELKKQYLDSIQKNQDNGFKNSQQSQLISTRRKAIVLALAIQKWAENKGAPRNQILNKLAPEGVSKTLLNNMISEPSGKR